MIFNSVEVIWVDVSAIVELVGQVGFMGAILIGLLWKLNSELDKLDLYHNERHQEMKSELKELKDENKQDKAMFANAVTSFENSVREFTIMSSKMANLEHDVKEIRNDIRELKQ